MLRPAEQTRPPALAGRIRQVPAWARLAVLARAAAHTEDGPVQATARGLARCAADLRAAVRHADRAPDCDVLVIDQQLPGFDSDSGAERMRRVVDWLCDQGAAVRVYAWLGGSARAAAALEARGVEVIPAATPLASVVAQAPARGLVIASRPTVAARFLPPIRATTASACVFDAVDLHWLREAREAAVQGRAPQAGRRLRRLEQALADWADHTVFVSEAERDLLGVPEHRATLVRNFHDRRPDPPPGRDGRHGVLFVGNFGHRPNVDAMIPLAELARRLPDTPFLVAGPGLDPAVAARLPGNVTVLGYVDDLAALHDRCVALVAPLRVGAGVKGKISYALSRGLPVITTPVGAEGMFLEPGRTALIGEDVDHLARAVTLVEDDHHLWASLSAASLAHADRLFGPTALAEAGRRLLEVTRR